MVYRALFRYMRRCQYWGKLPFVDDFIEWAATMAARMRAHHPRQRRPRSEEHTSELQSQR